MTNFFNDQFTPLSCHLLPLTYKQPPQTPGLKNIQSVKTVTLCNVKPCTDVSEGPAATVSRIEKYKPHGATSKEQTASALALREPKITHTHTQTHTRTFRHIFQNQMRLLSTGNLTRNGG